MDIEELKHQAVRAESLDIEACGQVAGTGLEGHIAVVHHAEILGRIKTIEILPIYIDAVRRLKINAVAQTLYNEACYSMLLLAKQQGLRV
jgi:hypothetical protein